MIWHTTGLNVWQRPAVEAIINECTFPWKRLEPLVTQVRGEPFIPVISSDLSRFRGAADHHVHESGRLGHIIEVREQVLGLFWSDGKIEIEQSIRDETLVKEVFLAEAAHSVDYFLPLTDAKKKSIALLLHGGIIDSHTWWEIRDYGEEYYRLMGESFMALFTLAYSNIEPWQEAFEHKATKTMVPEVYAILGIWPATEPTDPVPLPPVPEGPPSFSNLLLRLIKWLLQLFEKSK